MKKIFIIIFIFFIFLNNVEASCKIESWPSPLLKKYFENINKLLDNIASEAKTIRNEKRIDETAEKYRGKFLWILNEITNIDYIKDEINFIGIYWKYQEIPKEFRRDYNLLKSKDSMIDEIWNFIWKNALLDEKVKNDICKWVSNCNLKGENGENLELWEIIKTLKNNQERIKNIFIKTTIWSVDFDKEQIWNVAPKADENEEFKIILTESNFLLEMQNYYSPKEMWECSRESWLFERFLTQTKNIFQNEKWAKEWIKKWKEAWEQVTWLLTSSTRNYEAIEKDLLKKELARQWVWAHSQEVLLKNLDKFNQNWLSFDTNFLTWTFMSLENSIKNEYNKIKNEIYTDFLENYKKNKTEELTIKESLKVIWNSNDIKDITKKIITLYQENEKFAGKSENNSDNLKRNIIEIHKEIYQAINKLNDTCKLAVKICNQQDTWNGDCWDCNW